MRPAPSQNAEHNMCRLLLFAPAKLKNHWKEAVSFPPKNTDDTWPLQSPAYFRRCLFVKFPRVACVMHASRSLVRSSSIWFCISASLTSVATAAFLPAESPGDTLPPETGTCGRAACIVTGVTKMPRRPFSAVSTMWASLNCQAHMCWIVAGLELHMLRTAVSKVGSSRKALWFCAWQAMLTLDSRLRPFTVDMCRV